MRTTRDVGAIIRVQRRERGWTQAELADAVGVTRAWVIAIERGKVSANLGLVLRTFAVLGLAADVVPAPDANGGIDLDALLDDRRG